MAHSVLPLSSDALLVLLGQAIYLTICLAARQPLTWAWALLPGVCTALALEGWEILDHYGAHGLARSGSSDILAILLRHSKDVLVLNLAPGVTFLVALALERRSGR